MVQETIDPKNHAYNKPLASGTIQAPL